MLFWESGCGGLGEDGDSLWKRVLVAKHGVLRNGWDIQRLNYCASWLWRGVASTKEAFLRNIKFRVGSRDKVFFWLNIWIGVGPLVEAFLDLLI